MYYQCSENKGANQLYSYCEADLHLCFCISKMFSHDVAQIILMPFCNRHAFALKKQKFL